ncbi:MAG: glycosyl transferase [Chloroflexi bacterium]|nr:glycosyl transferase [Chloroflexota bacterium]
MQFGNFDDGKREYVISRPDTPLPWINYLGTEDYFGLISNTGGGYSFYQDARLRRLTRYRYNNVPTDTGGRYIYLQDAASGHFWSPTWQPTRTGLDSYTCRHGLGYTIIQSTYEEIDAEVRYFVPLGENLEIWELTLTNRRRLPAEVAAFSLAEFCLWDAQDDATNFQRNLNIGEVEVEDGVIYHKSEYRERRNHFAYFACSAPTVGFDTDREAFLGAYRGFDRPQVVERGQSCNSIVHGWAPIGSHHVQIYLKPGETRKIIFLLGYHENPPEHKFFPPGSQSIDKRRSAPAIKRYLDPLQVEQSFQDLKTYWDGLLSRMQVLTPDEHTNRMVNIWNAYQCMVTFNLSRSASYFESGIGRGIGFRDSNQDLLGFVHMSPERARQRILDLAATQMENGGAYHQFQPLTRQGNDLIGSGFNDDPLWLVVSASAYLKETGDWSLLEEMVRFDSRVGSEKSLYQHLKGSIRYTLDHLGAHQLPLIGHADWNDCLNLNTFSTTPGESFQVAAHQNGRTAESTFIAGLFILAAREMVGIIERVGDKEYREELLQSAASMEKALDRHGWDGNWYLRAYDAFGEKVGSQACAEGKIFVEPQGMVVMAGVGRENGCGMQALDSVHKHLATPHGIMLHQPAYTQYYLHLGEISSYPPGYKENAGVFCHTNPWIMIAEALLGNGDRAFDYYQRINPSRREEISEIHRSEPYVYAQMIAGKDAAMPGEAKNSWLTGTAAWNYAAITQYILGIRPELDGLRVDPAMPSNWEGFNATRVFRGVRYEIIVKRLGPGNETTLEVDGRRIEGNVVPLPEEGVKGVRVEARVGERKVDC